ncbi:class F sortase [Nakamurella leprariae]|nr:class F sortase [Nakamurella leprariae]
MVVLGTVVVVGAPTARWLTTGDAAGQHVSTVDAAAAQALAAPSTPPGLTPSTTTSASPSAPSTADPAPSTTPASTIAPEPSPAPTPASSAAPAPAPGAPVEISIERLRVAAAVVPVGVRSDGQLEIPQDVRTLGWYRFGPTPGATTGSAVVTGHVDDARQGAGVFARLGDLAPGDRLQVVDEAGTARWFTVVAREQWAKADVPLDRLFDAGGAGRLVLVTCGGDFDGDDGVYQDNIAVTAVPDQA